MHEAFEIQLTVRSTDQLFTRLDRQTDKILILSISSYSPDERDAGGAADGKTSASKLSGKAGVAKQAGIENAFKKLNLRNSLGGAVADSIYVEPDGKMPETNPTYSDFLVARATHPGNQCTF